MYGKRTVFFPLDYCSESVLATVKFSHFLEKRNVKSDIFSSAIETSIHSIQRIESSLASHIFLFVHNEKVLSMNVSVLFRTFHNAIFMNNNQIGAYSVRLIMWTVCFRRVYHLVL